MRHEIKTFAGVVNVGDQAGLVTVEHEDSDTLVALTVLDGDGDEVQVFLDYHQAAHLMGALGACVVSL